MLQEIYHLGRGQINLPVSFKGYKTHVKCDSSTLLLGSFQLRSTPTPASQVVLVVKKPPANAEDAGDLV